MFKKIIVTGLPEIFTVYSPKGRAEQITNRKTYGLSFCKSGQITYTHGGKKIISNKNCAILLPQGQTYSIFGDETGYFPLINFTCSNFTCNTVISLPLQQPEHYLHEFERLTALSVFPNNNAEMLSIFYYLLAQLSKKELPNRLLKPAVKYLQTHYADPKLSNAVLAQCCNLSEVYFRQCFTAQYKVSPRRFILNIRINKAKQLLSEGQLKIAEIALQCGFSNPYHFDRTFKAQTGLTPTEYMQQNFIGKL